MSHVIVQNIPFVSLIESERQANVVHFISVISSDAQKTVFSLKIEGSLLKIIVVITTSTTTTFLYHPSSDNHRMVYSTPVQKDLI